MATDLLDACLAFSRGALGSILAIAGLFKIHDRTPMTSFMRAFGITSETLSSRIATAITIAELVLGLALLTGVATRVASAAAVLLLIVFTAVLVTVLVKGDYSGPCGCFGTSTRPLGWIHVGGNLGLAGLALLVLFGAEWRGGQPPGDQQSWTAVALATMTVAAITMCSQGLKALTFQLDR